MAKNRQVFWVFFSLFLVVLPLVLILLYQLQSSALVKSTFTTLTEVTQFKQKGIESWLDERTADMKALVEPVAFAKLIEQVVVQKDDEALTILADQLTVFKRAYGYGKISLLDTECQAVYETTHTIPLSNHAQDYCRSAIQTRGLVINDLMKPDFATQQSHFDLIIPVFNSFSANHADAAAVFGVLVFHIDPHEFLVPYMALPPINADIGMSFMLQITPSGLQPLALQNNPAKLKQVLKLIPQLESQLAHFPVKGRFVADDLENDPFLVYQKIANTQWILVGMVDGAEVFKPLYQELFWVFVLAVVVLFLVGWLLMTQLAKQHLAQETRALVKQHDKLEKSRQYFMGLFMDSPVPYQSLDENGMILEVNQAWENLFGYYKEEVVGLPYQNFITDDSRQSLTENFPVLLATGKVQDVPFKIVRKDGQTRQVRLQGRISSGPDQPIRTHCSLQDMTQILKEQDQQSRVIKRTQALFNLMLHSSEMAEADLLTTALNELEGLTASHISFVHFVNEDQNEISLAAWSAQTTQKYCTAQFDKHYSIDAAGIWADCVRTREPVLVNDYSAIASQKALPQGHSQLERFMSVPIFNHGVVRMIVGVGNAEHNYDAFDVETVQLFGSELYQVILLKRTHEELLASEVRFHRLFEEAPVAYQSLDKEGHIREVNAAWLAMLGYDVAQKNSILTRSIAEFLTESSKQKLQKSFNTLLTQGAVNNLQFEVVRQDGSVRVVEVTGRISHDENGAIRTHCMLVDVTEKNQTTQALKLAAKVFESSGEGVMVTDSHQKIVSVNQAFSDILGFSKEEVLDKTPSIIKSDKHDKLFYDLMWDSIQSKGFWQGEV
ncbi:MAG: PAS domain S-box protein, partial [Thiotrichales bacterium]|nr:PAS domain S-box protein [Thiotrichales bacterium]